MGPMMSKISWNILSCLKKLFQKISLKNGEDVVVEGDPAESGGKGAQYATNMSKEKSKKFEKFWANWQPSSTLRLVNMIS